MDTRPNTLQITTTELPVFDWQTGAQHVRTLPGRVVVEQMPHETRRGVLYLPDAVAEQLMADIGVVIAVGDDIIELEPGDIVVMRATDGTWREGFKSGDYEAKGFVRCFGVFIAEGALGEPIPCPYWESIVARLDADMTINPIKDNLLIRRDPVLEKEGGIFLTEDAQFRTNCGTIVAAGPTAALKAGDRVVYHPEGMLDFDLTAIGGDKDLCIMPEGSIEAVLTGGENVTGIRQRGLAVA